MRRNFFKKITIAAVFLGVASGLMVWAGPAASAADRPAVEECMRCHDVKTYQHELKYSPHAVDKNKKVISCEQCHDTHFNPVTAYYARDEYFDKKIFEPGAFDRRRMQDNVRESVPSKKCLACHEDLSKNAKGEPISEIGQLCHDAFEGKNGSTNKNCAGCHINIAHLPEFDQNLTINAEYAKRLAENPMDAGKKEGK